MEKFKNLYAEWLSWEWDWNLNGYVHSQLQRIPGGVEKLEEFIAENQKELDENPAPFTSSFVPCVIDEGDDEGKEWDIYADEDWEDEHKGPWFATQDERVRWNQIGPKYPHPYLMLLISRKAYEIEEEYIITSMPEKIITGLATMANWQPFDEHLKVEITPLLGGWKVNDIISRWLKAHPEANLQDIPDLDGNPRWCRKE